MPTKTAPKNRSARQAKAPSKKPRFFLTTPIFYINDKPHIGHAYTMVAADALARWHRAKGEDVFFHAGTDENASKTVQAAKAAGEPVQAYADRMAVQWRATWDSLGFSYDDFIRTTEPRHAEQVLDFFKRIPAADIYKGGYEGWYCEGCEAFVTEKELVAGACPIHKKPAKRLKEENYFFRLSKYAPQVEAHLKAHPEFVQPASRRNEVLSFLREGAKDISITRPGLSWGIPFPLDPSHRWWVWLEALSNYRSVAPERWPADLHLVGKDIIRFHCVIWPALLLAAKLPLPKAVFAHGFFTIGGQKISKSIGNAIDPLALAKKYSRDSLCYYLLRDIPFGEDGDFSEAALARRHNGELLAELGNLVSRVTNLAEKHVAAGGSFKEGKALEPAFTEAWRRASAAMERLQFHLALEALFGFVHQVNKYVSDQEPWKQPPAAAAATLGNSLEAIRCAAIALSPFLPDTAAAALAQLGVPAQDFSALEFGAFKGTPKKGALLFQKAEAP